MALSLLSGFALPVGGNLRDWSKDSETEVKLPSLWPIDQFDE